MSLRRLRSERGAAAVEFALVLPFLLLLLLGIIEYGRLFYLQNSLTNAARVAARTMVIESSAQMATAAADAQSRAVSAAVVSPALSSGQVSVSACAANSATTVTISYPISQLSGFMPGFPTTLIGKAQMQCEG
jgi:Flp pilus assembly protein TadG